MSWFGTRLARRMLLLVAVIAGLVFAIKNAHAQVACDSLPGPRLYMQIGDTQQPLFKELGRALRDNGAASMTIIYITSPSCTNISSIYNDTPITTTMLYVPSASEMPGWTPSMAALNCAPPANTIADVTNSNVFISACDTNPVPSDIYVANGPVQAYVMAVPEASTETVITAEEAYYVFGHGPSAGMITPWNDDSQAFRRRFTTSTLLAWAYNLGIVPPTKFKGIETASSMEVVNALRNSTAPQKAIGILGAEVYDQFRNELDVLAFRGYRQYAAYYPDSSASSFDKKNLRDGHYTVWSPTVYLTRQTGGVPDNAQARYLLDLVRGHTVTPAPLFNPTNIIMHNGLIPDCAMEVQRDMEGGDLRRYQPTEECVCYFESQTGGTSCRTCNDQAACDGSGGGVCRNGYCEEQ